MNEYLIINIVPNTERFNIYTSKDIVRINKIIESKLNSSRIYSCDNKKLLLYIKYGLIAYLNNYFLPLDKISNDSDNWFRSEGLVKCFSYLDLFTDELINFKLINKFQQLDVKQQVPEFISKLETLKYYNELIAYLSEFVEKNKKELIYCQKDGNFILEGNSVNNINISISNGPEWFYVLGNKLIFDTKQFNLLKKLGIAKSGANKIIFDLISIKFFNKLSYNDFNK